MPSRLVGRAGVVIAFLAFLACLGLSLSAAAQGHAVPRPQGHAVPRPPAPPRHTVIGHGHVFIGGYFYDPYFGPYPWWPRHAYPYPYFPVYDQRAEMRIEVSKSGYRQFSTTINIQDGAAMPLNISLMEAAS